MVRIAPRRREADSPQRYRAFRLGDLLGAVFALILVAIAFIAPHTGLDALRPLINSTAEQIRTFAQVAPLFGWWNAHVGWGTLAAIPIAIGVAWWGPALARRLSWRWLAASTWLTSAAWATSLALIDGWHVGFSQRLTQNGEYLVEVPGVTDIPAMLRGFAARILDFQPDSWATHVSGHPPGVLLVFVWLDRIGLGGGAWAGALCVAVGSSAAMAILFALRALGNEATARRAAPFVALAPAAIWIAVSADALFAGVAAWGLALLALAATRSARSPAFIALGVGAGVLLGFGIFLSYGLVLMGLPALAILLVARSYRPLLVAVPAALAVVGVFALFGFWWFDGYQLVHQRYWQGIANNRPFAYWGWANFASIACALGVAVPAALARVFNWQKLRMREAVNVIAVACVIAIIIADLSRLSKAETERIWLPFEVWLLATPALLPVRSHRFWLIAQAAVALLINHFILTDW